MKDRIVVIGGYGHVGQTICRELGNQYPGKVYAAGRSMERAERFCSQTEGEVKPLLLDIGGKIDPAIWESTKLVMMCLDQSDPSFVRNCFRHGVHYVDISATGHFLMLVEQENRTAEANDSTAVLSVGLAPGLTNLLARQAIGQLDRTEEVDITVLLGLGDRHGKAAIEWTVDNVGKSFEVARENRKMTVNSFTGRKKVDFGPKLGNKIAYRFPFSDQQTLARTLNIPTVSTRLCFDSNSATRLFAGLRAAGVFRLIGTGPLRNLTIRSFSGLHIGQSVFAVKVEAKGMKAGKQTVVANMLVGKDQSAMTAKVAVWIAEAVCSSALPHGVHHIEQIFALEDFQEKLSKEAEHTIFLNGQPVLQ